MQLTILASGSKGNSSLIQASGFNLLVDAGLTLSEIDARLGSIGLGAGMIDAVLVTHEHIDHVRGVGPLARRHKTPVFATGATLACLKKDGAMPEPFQISSGREIEIGPFSVRPFQISHDAREPVGFVLTNNGARLGIATDLGIVTRVVTHHLAGCDCLVLESNHDPTMLRDGPYPADLKARIKGNRGHLSNQQAAELLVSLLCDRLNRAILAHLSEQNNTPELALECSRRGVVGLAGSGLPIMTAGQHEPTQSISI